MSVADIHLATGCGSGGIVVAGGAAVGIRVGATKRAPAKGRRSVRASAVKSSVLEKLSADH